MDGQISIAVDNLLIYAPQFQKDAVSFVGEFGGSSATFQVNSLDDFIKVFKSFSLVKYLEILVHGCPGLIYFGIDPLGGRGFAGRVPNSFLQKNARILFLSCSTGQGEAGDKFIKEVGESVLKGKGGFVGATTVTNYSVSNRTGNLIGARMLPNGKLKTRQFDESGKQIGSMTVDNNGNGDMR